MRKNKTLQRIVTFFTCPDDPHNEQKFSPSELKTRRWMIANRVSQGVTLLLILIQIVYLLVMREWSSPFALFHATAIFITVAVSFVTILVVTRKSRIIDVARINSASRSAVDGPAQTKIFTRIVEHRKE